LRLRVLRGGRGHFWEQSTLARATRGGRLVSLGNSGPVSHPDHVLCLHDAHLFEMPEAFSPAYRLLHRSLRPILAHRAKALITVSRHASRGLAQHLGVPEDRFSVIPNAADHALRWPMCKAVPQRYGLKPGGYLLCVGNQSPNKNLAALVAAHAQAGPDVLPLALVGGSVPGLSEVSVGAGAQHLGRVPDGDLRGLYEGAAAFVFPSLNEGFGIPPLEAMELGVPVICAWAGAMPEVLGDAPMWFDPCDTDDMAAELRRFSELPDAARAEMRAKGKVVAARYRWAKSAEQLADLVGTKALRRAA
jgi:glycosyltransferase involved in cell wall biosynthesis